MPFDRVEEFALGDDTDFAELIGQQEVYKQVDPALDD